MTDLQHAMFDVASRFECMAARQLFNHPDPQQIENIRKLLWIAYDTLPTIADAAGECTVNPEYPTDA